jgi:hypothetical protein
MYMKKHNTAAYSRYKDNDHRNDGEEWRKVTNE